MMIEGPKRVPLTRLEVLSFLAGLGSVCHVHVMHAAVAEMERILGHRTWTGPIS
jgi:hypothetical protein